MSLDEPTPDRNRCGLPAQLQLNYFFSSSVSMAPTTFLSEGLRPGAKRFTISPLRPIRNFSKFHFTSPANLGSVSFEVRYLYRSHWPSPFTTTFENMSNFTP